MYVRIKIEREVTQEEAALLSQLTKIVDIEKGDIFRMSTEPLDGLYKNPSLNPPELVKQPVQPIQPIKFRAPKRSWSQMVEDAFKAIRAAFPSFSDQIEQLYEYLDWHVTERINWQPYTVEDLCNLVSTDDKSTLERVVRRLLIALARPAPKTSVGFFLPPTLDAVARRMESEKTARELLNKRQTGDAHIGTEEDIHKKLELVVSKLNPEAKERYAMTMLQFLRLMDVHPANRSTALLFSWAFKKAFGYTPTRTNKRDAEHGNVWLYLFPPLRTGSQTGWPQPYNLEEK